MNLPTKTSLIVLAAFPVFGGTAVAGPLGIFWTMDMPHRMELFIDHGAVVANEKHGVERPAWKIASRLWARFMSGELG